MPSRKPQRKPPAKGRPRKGAAPKVKAKISKPSPRKATGRSAPLDHVVITQAMLNNGLPNPLKGYEMTRQRNAGTKWFLMEKHREEIGKKFPWIDFTGRRLKSGELYNTTAREKEVVGINFKCCNFEVCGMHLGKRVGKGLILKGFHFDDDHVVRGKGAKRKKGSTKTQGGVSASSKVRKKQRKSGVTRPMCKFCHSGKTTTECIKRKAVLPRGTKRKRIESGHLKGYELVCEGYRKCYLEDSCLEKVSRLLPYVDFRGARDDLGQLINTTAREKEVLGVNLKCCNFEVCGMHQGKRIGKGLVLKRDHFDDDHVVRGKGKKRKGYQGGVSASSKVRKKQRKSGVTRPMCKLCHAGKTAAEQRGLEGFA